ncbi:MAG: hypothetical protein P0S96_01980 [Simkaniaceae bacterium]|nr:hypothetical protein [Candidatus Sacchlamyda saccharinae]
MLSKIFEVQSRETEFKFKKKSPTAFAKTSRKRPLSKKLQEGSVAALKEMLAKQKQDLQMSAAGPFQKAFALEQTGDAATSLKIDPSVQVMQLYHKLCERLLHIHREGIQETTLFLDGDAFSSSAFEGAKITITEYSTAPKVFNIEFSADPRALSVFEAHAADLVHSLNQGKFGFTVHRLDTTLLTEDEKHALPPVERDLEKDENQ